LKIVMHLSNGMTFHEVAQSLNCSDANIHKHAGIARRKLGARSIPQLVSIVIAHGQLEWTDAGRVVNGDLDQDC